MMANLSSASTIFHACPSPQSSAHSNLMTATKLQRNFMSNHSGPLTGTDIHTLKMLSSPPMRASPKKVPAPAKEAKSYRLAHLKGQKWNMCTEMNCDISSSSSSE